MEATLHGQAKLHRLLPALVTVFFMVEQPRLARDPGDLRLFGSVGDDDDGEDYDGGYSPGKRNRKGRKKAPPVDQDGDTSMGGATAVKSGLFSILSMGYL